MIANPNNKAILHLDASALVQSACGLRLKFILIDGLREPRPFNDTLYGSAFHTFISKMAETKGNISEALTAAKKTFSLPCTIRKGKSHLTELHLMKTCLDYWEHAEKTDDFEILLNEDGKPCVEIYFETIVFEDDELIIALCGTMDKLGKFKNGCYAIGDYKTHSLYGAVKFGIPEFFAKFALSTQTHFYLHNLYLKAKEQPDSLLGKIAQTQVGFFIDGVFLNAKEPTVFARSDVMIPSKETLDEFTIMLDFQVEKLAKIWHHNRSFPLKKEGLINGACVDGKYLCKFWTICAACDNIARGHILRQNFIKKEYLPQLHGRE